MSDPRYPKSLDMSETPEWETPQQEARYWKKLALSYGAKLRAIELVMGKSWTARFDEASGEVLVEEDAGSHVMKPPSEIHSDPSGLQVRTWPERSGTDVDMP